MKRDCQCKLANHQHGTRTAYVVDKCRCDDCREASRLEQAARERAKAYGRYDTGRVPADPVRQHVRNLMADGIGLKQISRLTSISTATLGKLLYGIPTKNIPPRTRVTNETATKLLAIHPSLDTHANGALVDPTGTRRRLQALVAIGYSVTHLGHLLGMTPANTHTFLNSTRITAAHAKAVRNLYEQLWATPNQPTDHHGKAAATRARNHAARNGWLPPMAWDDDHIDNPNWAPVLHLQKGEKVQAKQAALIEEILFLARAGNNRHAIAHRLGYKDWKQVDRTLYRLGRTDIIHRLNLIDAA